MGQPATYRLFTLGNPNGVADCYAGRVPDGRGVLAGPSLDGLLVIWFDPAGQLIGPEVIPLPSSRNARARGLAPRSEDWTTDALGWLAGVGFRPEPVEVYGFSVEEPVPDEEADTRCAVTVSVSRYPRWAERLLEPGLADLNDPEVQRDLDLLRRWEEDGCFVLYWGKDYHLDKHGGHSS